MSYSGHLVFAGSLGAAFGYLGHTHFGFSQPLCILAAGLCTLGGLLPDLDRLNEDGNTSIRELFSVAVAGGSILLLRRLQFLHLEGEELILALGGVFLAVRYGFLQLVKQLSVHRGMFHSIPAVAIAGLATYLIFHHPDCHKRIFVATATMIGFLSHLMLDQFNVGLIADPKSKSNGIVDSALKVYSKSKWATGLCYSILGGMGYLTKVDSSLPESWRDDLNNVVQIGKEIGAGVDKFQAEARNSLPKDGVERGTPAAPVSRKHIPEAERGNESKPSEGTPLRPRGNWGS